MANSMLYRSMSKGFFAALERKSKGHHHNHQELSEARQPRLKPQKLNSKKSSFEIGLMYSRIFVTVTQIS